MPKVQQPLRIFEDVQSQVFKSFTQLFFVKSPVPRSPKVQLELLLTVVDKVLGWENIIIQWGLGTK